MSNAGTGFEWIKLTNSTLGTLDLMELPYSITELTFGYPSPRTVNRSSPLMDGERDTTERHAGRTVRFQLEVYQGEEKTTNEYVDDFRKFCHPAETSWLYFKQQGSGERRIMVKPEDIQQDYLATRPSWHVLNTVWKAPTGRYECDPEHLVLIRPELEPVGRTYDLVYDREYPYGGPISGANINNSGSAVAPVILRLFGPMSNIAVYNDTVGKNYTFNSGFGVLVDDYVEIHSENREILLNGEPDQSVLHELNFVQSDWWSLARGQNNIRLISTGGNEITQLQIIWRCNFI
jgi:hypothetical protein